MNFLQNAPDVPVETPLFRAAERRDMDIDPFFIALVAIMVFLMLFFFLLLRRTMLSFKEGMDDSRR
jgi:hypothetical protein